MRRTARYLTLMLLLPSFAAFGGELDGLIAECNGCHGDNGVSQSADVPTIAGLSMFYQSDQLYFFSEGERPCGGDSPTMCDVAAGLSEDDFDALAEHYAELPFVAAEQPFDADKAAAGKAIHESHCARCHSDGGSNAADDAGILAGQHMAYLATAMEEFRSGDREVLESMKEQVDALSDSDVEALLHYYASQQ